MVRAIKPECIKEYKKTHSDVWPEILERITNCKIKNYSVLPKVTDYLVFLSIMVKILKKIQK